MKKERKEKEEKKEKKTFIQLGLGRQAEFLYLASDPANPPETLAYKGTLPYVCQSFLEFDWYGILVDANPMNFMYSYTAGMELFKDIFHKTQWLSAACWPNKNLLKMKARQMNIGGVDGWAHIDKIDNSYKCTFTPEEEKDFKSSFFTASITPDQIVELATTDIHLLVMDMEGTERLVLRRFLELIPELEYVQYEFHSTRAENEMGAIMEKHNFSLIDTFEIAPLVVEVRWRKSNGNELIDYQWILFNEKLEVIQQNVFQSDNDEKAQELTASQSNYIIGDWIQEGTTERGIDKQWRKAESFLPLYITPQLVLKKYKNNGKI